MHRHRLKILTFVRYYLPGYKSGGPVRTIANMVEHLGEDFEFMIVTSDRDALDSEPYADVWVDRWNEVGKGRVFYASPGNRSVVAFARIIRETPHDVLYLNSFYDPVFTLRPLLARALGLLPERPTVIAPRGEFSRGALALKEWKKRPYILAAKSLGLYRNVVWQASSEHEVKDIRHALGRSAHRIQVAPNLPPADRGAEHTNLATSPAAGPLRIVFLSRITPKKNLDFALRVLAQVSVPVQFDIYGILEDGAYWACCSRLIGSLPPHIVVRYKGAIPYPEVAKTLAGYDVFFLPTLGENYGHAIIEALAAGLPVLLSDRTPWRNLQEFAIGWDLPLEAPDSFVGIVEQQARLSDTERRAQSNRARAFAAQVTSDGEIITRNRALFVDLVRA